MTAPTVRRRELSVGVGAVILALAALVTVFFVVRGDSSGAGAAPEDAINAYVDAARDKDVEAAKQVLVGDALEDLEDGTEGSVFEEGIELVDFEIGAVDIEGDEATAEIDATFEVDGTEHDLEYIFDLEKHGDDWKIADATVED